MQVPSHVEYERATSVEHALELLARFGPESRVLAGGHSLIPMMKLRLARLSRVAYRIVWANPRTKSPRYRPEVSGMAAAWPYCDAVVSAHSLNAIDDLITALASSA